MQRLRISDGMRSDGTSAIGLTKDEEDRLTRTSDEFNNWLPARKAERKRDTWALIQLTRDDGVTFVPICRRRRGVGRRQRMRPATSTSELP